MFDFLFGLFSHDLAIDLGTANTLVAIKDKGIVIREPSVVARHKKTKKILAVGPEAKKMLGKTPTSIEVLRPLRHGVISDFDATAAMLTYYIKLVHERPNQFIPSIPRPKVVVGIPSGVTEVERRAVQEACFDAGARAAYLIEEPMAGAIGAGLPVSDSKGSLIVDIGGGTTEIAVISLGGIVVNRSVRVAGDELDLAIVSFVRLKHSLLIGDQTAEQVKISVGSAFMSEKFDSKQTVVRGRGIESGLPRSLKLNAVEVREAIAPVVNQIVRSIADVIEETPPEFIGDIMEQGITLAGGGALIRGIDTLIAQEVKMPVWISEDPQTAVVRGALKLLEDEELLKRVRVTGGLK
ncbi:rod shape-determining protein [Candidatus Microgenomates bacterium]|nr:MAG: rod shape-determining protein [Candidatus Microgenomates bacterium]